MTIDVLRQESCEDAISREAALNCLLASNLKKFDWIIDARDKIKALPSVSIRSKGEWLQVDDDADAFDCSECGYMYSRKYNFCPNCGSHNGGS